MSNRESARGSVRTVRVERSAQPAGGGLSERVVGGAFAAVGAAAACTLLSGWAGAQELLVFYGGEFGSVTSPSNKPVFQHLDPNPAPAVSPLISSLTLTGLTNQERVSGATIYPGAPNGIPGPGMSLYFENANSEFAFGNFHPQTGAVNVGCYRNGLVQAPYIQSMLGVASDIFPMQPAQGGVFSWGILLGTDFSDDGHSYFFDSCSAPVPMPVIADLPFGGPYVGPAAANRLPFSTYDSDAYVISEAPGGETLHRINPDTLASLLSWTLSYEGNLSGFTVGTDEHVYALAVYSQPQNIGELRLLKSTTTLGSGGSLSLEQVGTPIVDWFHTPPPGWAVTQATMLFDRSPPQIQSFTASATSVLPCEPVELCASWTSGPATALIQPGGIPIANGGCVDVLPPAGATTQYQLVVTSLGPNGSHTAVPSAQQTVPGITVETPSCATATPMNGLTQAFDNSCMWDAVSTNCVRRPIWYSFVAPYTGTGHVEVTGETNPSALAVWSGPCASALEEGCNVGPTGVDFPMNFGDVIYVQVGSDGPLPTSGVLEVSGQVAPDCPSITLPKRNATYFFSGTATGAPWSWRIESADNSFQEVFCGLVPGVPASSPVEVVVAAFADSINTKLGSLGCAAGEFEATVYSFAPDRMSISYRSAMPSGGLRLYVGPQNDPFCHVTVGSAGNDCQFAYGFAISVEREDVSEEDCNENGVSDFFDIILGTSQDQNGDSIPDECADLGTPYCFGDGSGTACPCGATGNPGEGCANTGGLGGAILHASGNAYIGNDTFKIQVVAAPGNKPGLILRGISPVNGGLGGMVGDGLLCTSGSTARSQVQVTSNGATLFTDFQNQPFGASSYGPGVTANYQFWYRDPGNTCSGGGFNFSNAWAVTWKL